MSYDLRVWSLKELPESECGTVEHGRDWVVNVSSAPSVETELPQQISDTLPGVQFVVEVSLEPTDSAHAGITALWNVARRIAKAAQGVIEDPQLNSFDGSALVSGHAGLQSNDVSKRRRRRGLSQAEVQARLNANPEYHARRAKRE